MIDLHSHINDIPGLRLQALDSVTTALELEAGVFPVEFAYRHAAADGRPLNYGFATSWAHARMEAVAGLAPSRNLALLGNLAPRLAAGCLARAGHRHPQPAVG